MKKEKYDNRIPKYFNSDGNGIHLEVGRSYLVKLNSKKNKIFVLEEYRHLYSVEINGLYTSSLSKYQENLQILR